MRHCSTWFAAIALLAASPMAFAGGKGEGGHKGGGSKPHAASPPKVHTASPPKPHNPPAPKPQAHAKGGSGHSSNTTAHAKTQANSNAANSASAIHPANVNPYAGMFGMTGAVHHAAIHHGYAHPRQRYRRPNHNTTSPNAHYQARIRHLEKIKADLDAVTKGAIVHSSQKTTLQHDLMAVVQGTAKPPAPSVHQLSNDLIEALANRTKPAVNTREMTYALEAVMNSVNLMQEDVRGAIREGATLLKSSGVPADHARSVTRAMELVAFTGTNNAGVNVGTK